MTPTGDRSAPQTPAAQLSMHGYLQARDLNLPGRTGPAYQKLLSRRPVSSEGQLAQGTFGREWGGRGSGQGPRMTPMSGLSPGQTPVEHHGCLGRVGRGLFPELPFSGGWGEGRARSRECVRGNAVEEVGVGEQDLRAQSGGAALQRSCPRGLHLGSGRLSPACPPGQGPRHTCHCVPSSVLAPCRVHRGGWEGRWPSGALAGGRADVDAM